MAADQTRGETAHRPSGALATARHSLLVHSVVLVALLVVVTAGSVAFVIVEIVGQQVEQAADRRLADGVALFQTSLDAPRTRLLTVGGWLARDPSLLGALRDHDPAAMRDRLATAAAVSDVDEVVVADDRGTVVARIGTGAASGGLEASIAGDRGFAQAMAGHDASGLTRRADEPPRQAAYVPLRPAPGGAPLGVVRVTAFLGQADLDRFRARTGLDVSVFFGPARLLTTLRDRNGAPLRGVGPDPAVYDRVVGRGESLVAWRDLPIGRMRTEYVPLTAPDGARVGMLAVALPADAILGAWQRALYPAVPLTLLIVLAGTVLAYLLARRLRQPLLALAAAAARLEQGDFTTAVPPVREPELAPLAVQLDRARRIVAERLGAITREEARQRALFAALREPILLTSADGRIVGTNPAARALVDGWVALEGRAIRDLFPFLADGDPADPDDPTWQGQILDRTGRTRDLEVSRATLVETSLPTGYAYVVHDVSRHVELTRMREQLLYNVAHELNGPIGVLAGAIEVLAEAYADLTARDFERLIRAARRTAGHLVDLTGGLLSVGSIRSGQFAIHPEPVELGALVDTAVDTVAARLEARGQWIERVGFDAGLAVRADPRYVRQVIRNLLANASTYGPGGAPIRIVAAREGDAVRVAVEDRGPGIPAAQRQAIFERFQRGATAAEAMGTGLGLAIAREIVAAHGGQIGLESDEGSGTRVWFTLPAAAGEEVGE